MDSIVVRGGVPLRGEVSVGGSKNAALPLLFATLLTEDECRLNRVPRLVDIRTALRLLGEAEAVERSEEHEHALVASDLDALRGDQLVGSVGDAGRGGEDERECAGYEGGRQRGLSFG